MIQTNTTSPLGESINTDTTSSSTYSYYDDINNSMNGTTLTSAGIYGTGVQSSYGGYGGYGSAGQILTVGTGSTQWSNPTTMDVRGDMEVTGDILLNGKSLSEFMDKLEQRLAILHPNEKLESRWEALKSLGDQYRQLEKEILEKEQIWSKLKN